MRCCLHASPPVYCTLNPYHKFTTVITVETYNLRTSGYYVQQATCSRPITTAIKLTCCKEMGGATFHACQSGTLSVSKRLILSTGRYAVIGCSLRTCKFLHNIVNGQYCASEGCKRTFCTFYPNCDGGFSAGSGGCVMHL